MKIAIEAERANQKTKTGVEHYAQQVIWKLAQLDRENQYIIYLRTPPQPWFGKLPSNFSIKVLPFPIFWTQIRLSVEFLFNKVDALWIPASALPLIHPKNSVVTIHDIAWEFFPDTFTGFMKWYLKFSTWYAVKHARAIIAVSSATKRDLIKRYDMDPEKIFVVHHGYTGPRPSAAGSQVSDRSQSIEDLFPELKPESRKILGSAKYLLYIGTLQPRKNLERLLDAFIILKSDHPYLDHKLVIAGWSGWKSEQILAKIKDYEQDVIYLGYVTDKQRAELLKRANAFVLPSLYEGFGMPILEAFAVGVPVATSQVSSMPEVAGDAAIYFEPNNTRSMIAALSHLLSDWKLRQELVEKGKLRLEKFSWEKCARETLDVVTGKDNHDRDIKVD